MDDTSVKLDVILSLAFSPLIPLPILHLLLYPSFPPPPTWALCSTTSPLPKEKSKWEGKQNSLESELMELHETVASLQSRLRRAELQGMEAQVNWCWFGEGGCCRSSPPRLRLQLPGSSWPVVIPHPYVVPSFLQQCLIFSGCPHVPEGHY